MHLYDSGCEEAYGREDIILGMLAGAVAGNDTEFISHKWLLDAMPKRLVYWDVYGDLLQADAVRRRILDIGGGYCSLTRTLVRQHDYQLMDIMSHDDHGGFQSLIDSIGTPFWIDADWYDADADDSYDLIIANDLFPNVDQRLSVFLDKYLPKTYEIRLSLTYYNQPRFYRVQRIGGDETFFIVPWNGNQLAAALSQYADRIEDADFAALQGNAQSLFANGRHVCKVVLRGDR